MIHQERARQLEKDRHKWEEGRFNAFRKLSPDTKGDLGENFIVWLLCENGRAAECNAGTDPTEKHWDIDVKSDEVTLEVKTATLGYSTPSFQHENLEQNRKCDGLVFLDIAPDTIYITCMCKHTFDWKGAHHRRHGIQFKKDLTLKWVREHGSEVKKMQDFMRNYDKMLSEIRDYRQRTRRGQYQGR